LFNENKKEMKLLEELTKLFTKLSTKLLPQKVYVVAIPIHPKIIPVNF
jgi:hypothetical protein